MNTFLPPSLALILQREERLYKRIFINRIAQPSILTYTTFLSGVKIELKVSQDMALISGPSIFRFEDPLTGYLNNKGISKLNLKLYLEIKNQRASVKPVKSSEKVFPS